MANKLSKRKTRLPRIFKFILFLGITGLLGSIVFALGISKYVDYSEKGYPHDFARKLKKNPMVTKVEFFGYSPRIDTIITTTKNNKFKFYKLDPNLEGIADQLILLSVNDKAVLCFENGKANEFDIVEHQSKLERFPKVESILDFVDNEDQILAYLNTQSLDPSEISGNLKCGWTIK